MTRQETINKAVAWATGIANDSAHGYDQADRWGSNYDCSSFVISAWRYAGVPVDGASYTGNMYFAFINCGFVDVTNQVNLATGAGLKKGDVLLNKANHTELYIGSNKVVKASINENGGTTGGKSGDQTGREIYAGGYYNYPWDCVLRFMGAETDKKEESAPTTSDLLLPTLQLGDTGECVRALQLLLIGRKCPCGWYGADGDYGNCTFNAVKDFQEKNGLAVDGICGLNTWKKLLGL